MSYKFPKDTKWEATGYKNCAKELCIYTKMVISCEYNYDANYYYIQDMYNTYFVYTEEIPEFEKLFPEFPYNCIAYLANVLEEKEELVKRLNILEKTH